MSAPPPNSPQYGYNPPPPGYAPLPPKNSAVKIVLIVLACVFGGGIFLVAILAAILFSVFQKVRSNARLSTCLSNVRLIELGFVQYTQDHNGKLPPSAAGYQQAVSSYGINPQVFHCPAAEGEETDHAMNANLQNVDLDRIAHPSKVILIYEGQNQTLAFRHGGKTVVGFADGHDKALTLAQVQYWTQTQDLRWKP